MSETPETPVESVPEQDEVPNGLVLMGLASPKNPAPVTPESANVAADSSVRPPSGDMLDTVNRKLDEIRAKIDLLLNKIDHFLASQ